MARNAENENPMKIQNAVCYSIYLSNEGASTYLRLIEPLKRLGINIVNGIEDNQINLKRVSEGDIVIIQRAFLFLKENDRYKEIIEFAHREGKPVVYDLDDLLFSLPENHPDRQSGAYNPSLLPMLQTLMKADLVSVSTPKLRDVLADYNDNVVVLPNYFDDNLWHLAPPALKNSSHEILTIGYMGTYSHQPDLEYITPVLLDLIKRYPHKLRFHFWGVQPSAELESLHQVKWIPAYSNSYKDFAEFFQTQSADIFIAPLVDNLFNRCKSPLKFFEYSALGAPGVFSRLDPYELVVTHGQDGLLASSLDEWTDCLLQLVENDELRFQLATNAQATIRENWLLSKKVSSWDETYQSAFDNLSSNRDQNNKIVSIVESINLQLLDVLNKKEAAEQALSAQVAEKEQIVQALSAQIVEITNSRTWKLTLLFRRIRGFIIPHNSRRERVLRRLIDVFFLVKKIRRNRKFNEELALIKSSGLFDETWYLAHNADVAQAKMEPLPHFLRDGSFEGRDPGPNFSSAWYLNTYDDVKKVGINPLVHYLKHGREEGRTAQPTSAALRAPNGFSQLSTLSDYDKWIAANEPSPADLEIQQAQAKNFGYRPLFSVVMPVWNTPGEILNETIMSVVEQTYDKWELCVADGNSNPETKNILTSWAKKDGRIKIKFLDENKGIAANSNEALLLAQGEFVAFLDHDDLLAPFALFEVISRLQSANDVDVIYSDEDKMEQEGRRLDAFFKPDFSPDYLRSVNYMPHFLVVRKSLGDQVTWFREGYDGAQDYDLILRLVEKARVIAHIPKVLYHWRVWSASTSGGAEAKPYANESGKKALREHLNRIGLPAQVEDGYSSTFYRAHYHISTTPQVSIIIRNQDHAVDLNRCIESILQKTTYPNFEIILAENGSKESETFKLYERLKQDARIHIIKWDEPFNNSRMNNWAAKQASGEVFLFLNNDTQVINKDWLEQMLQFALRPNVGVVGAKLYYPDGTIQHGGIILGIKGTTGHAHRNFPHNDPGYFFQLVLPHNVSAVTGTCLMLHKKVFQEVDGFDENYSHAFGDVNLCLSLLKKGYLNVWTPYAELYQHESESRKYESNEKQAELKEDVDRFKQKWSGILQEGDSYYNPNLTLTAENFSINLNPVSGHRI